MDMLDVLTRKALVEHVPSTDALETRLLALTPKTYDEDAREVSVVLSRGSPVQRFYGTESLRITKDAIDLSRLESGGIPLLDSHRQDSITAAVGRVVDVWIENRKPVNALMGRIRFSGTEQGRKAEQMVQRGEIGAVSIGYRVDTWRIGDEDGNEIDPDAAEYRVRWDKKLTFEATKWELLEASLVAVPADASAVVRNSHRVMIDEAYAPQDLQETLVRMQIRYAIQTGELLPTPEGPQTKRLVCSSIHPPSTSIVRRLRSRPRGVR
jgi:phage head maturation protease